MNKFLQLTHLQVLGYAASGFQLNRLWMLVELDPRRNVVDAQVVAPRRHPQAEVTQQADHPGADVVPDPQQPLHVVAPPHSAVHVSRRQHHQPVQDRQVPDDLDLARHAGRAELAQVEGLPSALGDRHVAEGHTQDHLRAGVRRAQQDH